MLEIFSEVDFPFFVIFRIISFQTIWWGAFFSSFCSRKRAEDIFWRPPVADWKETELTDRAHTVCPRGAGLKKKKRETKKKRNLFLFHGVVLPGGERSFLPETLEGKGVFVFKRVTRWSGKRKMAPHSSLTATYHAIYTRRRRRKKGFFFSQSCHHLCLLLVSRNNWISKPLNFEPLLVMVVVTFLVIKKMKEKSRGRESLLNPTVKLWILFDTQQLTHTVRISRY